MCVDKILLILCMHNIFVFLVISDSFGYLLRVNPNSVFPRDPPQSDDDDRNLEEPISSTVFIVAQFQLCFSSWSTTFWWQWWGSGGAIWWLPKRWRSWCQSAGQPFHLKKGIKSLLLSSSWTLHSFFIPLQNNLKFKKNCTGSVRSFKVNLCELNWVIRYVSKGTFRLPYETVQYHSSDKIRLTRTAKGRHIY